MCRHLVTDSCHSRNARVCLAAIFHACTCFSGHQKLDLHGSIHSFPTSLIRMVISSQPKMAELGCKPRLPRLPAWHRLPCAYSHTFVLISGSNFYIQSAIWTASEDSFTRAHRFPLYIQSTVWVTSEGSFTRPHRLIIVSLAWCTSIPCLQGLLKR